MFKRPFFLAGCLCLTVTAVAFFCSFPWWSGLLFLVLPLLAVLFAHKERRGVLLFAGLVTALSCLSVTLWQFHGEEVEELAGQTVWLEGVVTDVQSYDSMLLYKVESQLSGRKFQVDLSSYSMERIEPGHGFRALVQLEEKEERYWGSGTLLQGTCSSLQDLGEIPSIKGFALQLREKLKERITHLYSGVGREVMLGLLLGEKDLLSERTEQVFQWSGTLHLLTVSGFHISLLAKAVFELLQRLLRRGPKIAAFLTLPFLLLLALVEGMTVSVTRALLMGLLLYIAEITERDYDGLSAWGMSVLFVLLPMPYAVLDGSFLLSFGATLGILLFRQPLQNALFHWLPLPMEEGVKNRVLYCLVSTTAVSISANVLTAPLLLIYFGSLPLMALLVNLLVLPLLPGILVLGFAALLLPIDVLAQLLARFAQLLGGVLYRILSEIADWKLLYYGQENHILLGFLLLYGLIALLYFTKAKRKQVLLTLSAYMALFLLLGAVLPLTRTPAVELISCRSALVLTYEGRAAVIGQINSRSDRIEVMNVLQSADVETLDLLFLSGETSHGGLHALELVKLWQPSLVSSREALDAFDLQGQLYQVGTEQTVHFWNNWSVSAEENGAILSNGERNFLKIHEKYAIINYMTPELTAVLGDDYLLYGDAFLPWTMTWQEQPKCTIEVSDNDSGTGKPAAGANQRE